MMSLSYQINCGAARLLFVEPAGVFCPFQSQGLHEDSNNVKYLFLHEDVGEGSVTGALSVLKAKEGCAYPPSVSLSRALTIRRTRGGRG